MLVEEILWQPLNNYLDDCDFQLTVDTYIVRVAQDNVTVNVTGVNGAYVTWDVDYKDGDSFHKVMFYTTKEL